MAQQLNTGNGDALHTIACMAQAIARNVSLTELTEDERGVMAHFKNPAMPSVAVTADAAIKIAVCPAGVCQHSHLPGDSSASDQA